jgi:hypothetical protein
MTTLPLTPDNQTPPLTEERPVTARVVADYLGLAPQTVMRKYKQGVLPGHPVPGSNRARFWLSEVVASMREGGR